MTLPDEERNALIWARLFLQRLLDPKQTPRVPSSIRKEAAQRLKHYPYGYRIDELYGVRPGLTSSCCSAPVVIAGRTTHYHVCTTCGQPCDATKPEKLT